MISIPIGLLLGIGLVWSTGKPQAKAREAKKLGDEIVFLVAYEDDVSNYCESKTKNLNHGYGLATWGILHNVSAVCDDLTVVIA